MASSKVMPSAASPPNRVSPRQPSPNMHRGFASINMDDMLRNIYPDSDSFTLDNTAVLADVNRNKTLEDVWRDIVSEGAAGREPAMTLEDFLAKAGAVTEDDIRVPAPSTSGIGMETAIISSATGVPTVQFAQAVCVNDGMTTGGGFGANFGNGIIAVGGGAGGRGKRRRVAVNELPLDKATQQKQRRMIKNRESAAKSRERKQAYTEQLESLVTQLEEDNARLLKEEAELNKERYKQLMESIIPVTENRRPPRIIKRVHSMEW